MSLLWHFFGIGHSFVTANGQRLNMHGGHTVARPESGFLFHVLNIYFSKSVKIFRQMNTRSVAFSEIFVTLVQIILEREMNAICFHLQLNLHSRVSEDWGKVLVVVILFLKKNHPISASFVYFLSFHTTIHFLFLKSIDLVVAI